MQTINMINGNKDAHRVLKIDVSPMYVKVIPELPVYLKVETEGPVPLRFSLEYIEQGDLTVLVSQTNKFPDNENHLDKRKKPEFIDVQPQLKTDEGGVLYLSL
jgi:hypothetical protein